MTQNQLQLDPATIRHLRSTINRAIECRGAIEGGYTLFRRISCGLSSAFGPSVDTLTNEDLACLDFVMDHNLAMLADYLSAIDFTLNPIPAPEDSNEPDAKSAMFDRAIFKNDVRYRRKEKCRIERGQGRARVIDMESDEELLSLPDLLTDEQKWEVFDWEGDALHGRSGGWDKQGARGCCAHASRRSCRFIAFHFCVNASRISSAWGRSLPGIFRNAGTACFPGADPEGANLPARTPTGSEHWEPILGNLGETQGMSGMAISAGELACQSASKIDQAYSGLYE